MTTTLYPAGERGTGEYGWLSTRYSFSFADWYEPTRMGFGALRVLNDDRIAPMSGFGKHAHRDMEIITIVFKGTVTHEDSMGNTGTVTAGEVQVMSAGTGVTHAERNDSSFEELELLQLWVVPREEGITPRYEQKAFPDMHALLVSPDGREGSLCIMQDAFISRARVEPGVPFRYSLYGPKNSVYVFLVEGEVKIGDVTLQTRDALGTKGESELLIEARSAATLIIIEVPEA